MTGWLSVFLAALLFLLVTLNNLSSVAGNRKMAIVTFMMAYGIQSVTTKVYHCHPSRLFRIQPLTDISQSLTRRLVIAVSVAFARG